MKSSKIFILFAMLFVVAGAFAQPRIAREVHVGAIGGATLSNYYFGQSNVVQDMAQGYTFGVAARYVEEKYFGLQTELLLTRRGLKDHFEKEDLPEGSYQRDFTYVEVPILAHIYFGLGKRNEISVDLGPKFGYLIGDKTSSHLEGEAWENIKNYTYHGYKHHDIDPKYKFDYGLQGGLGYEFKLNNGMSVQLQGRFFYGLSNIFPDKASDTFKNSSNQHFQIVATVWYRSQIAKYMIYRKQRQYSKKAKYYGGN